MNTEPVLFPEKIVISCVTKSKGPLTKIIKLDPTTKELIKDGSECSMSSGTIKRVKISSPVGFAKMLRSRETNQAIVHGLSDYDEAKIVTVGQLEKYSGDSGTNVISRTKKYLKYPEKKPGVILFDHDKARALSAGEDKALATYSPQGLLSCLSQVHSNIGNAAYVSTPSTSSCIYSSSGELLRGEGTGSHIYLFVKNASDIPRYLAVIGKRLFLAGLGRMEISRSGALLPRTLVDLLVGSPERLDFVAGAVCKDGLVQKLPDPVVKNGDILDTESLKNLTANEEKEYLSVLADLSKKAKPNQDLVISDYISRESSKLVAEKNISIDEARRIVTSRQEHVLEDDDLLYFSRHEGPMTVAEVFLAGASFDKRSLADPLEPEYDGWSKSKAIFYWNDGVTTNIRSFAHGETKYLFRRLMKEKSPEQVMFERFVFLASENKVIDTVGHDIKDSMMIERAFIVSQAGAMHEYTDEEGNVKVMPLTKYWLMSEEKKVASSLKYRPGKPLFFANGDGRSYYNTFRFPYQLAQILSKQEREQRLLNWNIIMDTVFHEHRPYIEDWLCFTIQHPEKRSQIMPICISDVGLGKSLIMAIMSRVVGYQNFSNAKILDVTGLGKSGNQWGDWIYNKKISCIEEIDPEGESGIAYKIVDALKDIITNETLPLNLKGGRNGTFRIFSNIIGFSNHKNCVKVPYGDRRLFIVDSTGQKLLPHTKYEELWNWINDEQNIIAVYQYLCCREISDEFIPGKAKMTAAKKGLQVDGRSTMQTAFDLLIEQFPSDLMTNGEIQWAICQALKHIEGSENDYSGSNWNADKQFQAILKTTTTLVAEGKRIRVRRKGGENLQPSLIRAIRNGQDWIGATNNEIRDAMFVTIPWKWIREDDEKEVPF